MACQLGGSHYVYFIYLIIRNSCHTLITWMASHQCGSSHVPFSYLNLRSSCCISHFFLKAPDLRSSGYTFYNWLAFHLSGFPHVFSIDLTNKSLASLGALVWPLSLQAYWFLDALDTICALELLLLPVWSISCVFKWPDRENLFPYFVNLNGFSFVWVLICVFKLPDSENLLSGFAYINGFSSVWIPSYVFNWPDQLKSCHTWCT